MNTLNTHKDTIAATMKRLSFLATCMDAIEEWKRRTVYKECKLSVVNALLDTNDAVWIDKPLLTDVIADILEFVARSSENNDNLKLTVATSGIKSIHISINFIPFHENHIEIRSPLLVDRFRDVTLEIISQHGGRLEFSKERNGCRIMLYLPLIVDEPQKRRS